jgi:hypothetical protein
MVFINSAPYVVLAFKYKEGLSENITDLEFAFALSLLYSSVGYWYWGRGGVGLVGNQAADLNR